MPRTRSKKISYREFDSSSEEDSSFGMITSILGLLIQHNSGQKKKKPAGRPSKKRPPPGNPDESHCHHCHKTAPKRKCSSRKSQSKGKGSQAAKPSTSTDQNVVDLESDEEIAGTSITETHTGNIKNKVDNFFKALESDDEESEEILNKKSTSVPPEKKTRDFYTLLSDSEDEKVNDTKEKVSDVTEDLTSSISQPSTSGLSNILSTGLKSLTNSFNLNTERKTEDLFAYVDDILNECNEVVDITDDKSKGNAPVYSLEDLQKKTNEIVGGVASLIDELKPKPKEPENKSSESPSKEAPTCPICLEHIGGTRQAMATLCGHMFCEPCLLQVVKTTKKCPSCRKGLTKTKYHPVYI